MEKYDYPIENVYVPQTGQYHPHLIQSKSALNVKQLEPLFTKIRVVPGWFKRENFKGTEIQIYFLLFVILLIN